MAVYLINALVVPFRGDRAKFEIEKISIEQARVLTANGFTSVIGHASTAELLSQLLKVSVPTQRIQVFFEPGDTAVAFVLLSRIPEGKVLSSEEINSIGYIIYKITRLE
jgi:hypothetical protein